MEISNEIPNNANYQLTKKNNEKKVQHTHSRSRFFKILWDFRFENMKLREVLTIYFEFTQFPNVPAEALPINGTTTLRVFSFFPNKRVTYVSIEPRG